MAKVLLVQPNADITDKEEKVTPFTPLSLIYLGTAIEGKHEVKIYDRNLNNDDESFLRLLEKYNPQIIGFTSVASTMLFDIIHLGKLIKKSLSNTIIIVGGVHATIDPDSILNEPYIDYIMRGEGEEAFLDFCNTFDKDTSQLGELMNVNKNPLRPFIDMNELKFPNYNLIDIDKYEEFYISVSRGCIGNCTFCYNAQMWGVNNRPFVRAYSTEKAEELFRRIIEKYKRKVFFIADDNFLAFKTRCIKICSLLEKYKVHFYISARADCINDEVLIALKKAGCHTVAIGIESGSQKMLDLMNKKTSVKQNAESIRLCKKHKVTSSAHFMIGLPTETSEDLQETVNFIKKYEPDVVNIHIYNPLPAVLFDFCISKNLCTKPKTLEEWAGFGGVFGCTKNNVSEISNEELQRVSNSLHGSGSFWKKSKRLMFWIKVGEFKFVAKAVKRGFDRMKRSLVIS